MLLKKGLIVTSRLTSKPIGRSGALIKGDFNTLA